MATSTKAEIQEAVRELDADIGGDLALLTTLWLQVKHLAESHLIAEHADGPDPLSALTNEISQHSRSVRRRRDERARLVLVLGEMALKD